MASKMTPAKLTTFMLLGVGLLIAFYVGKKIFAKEETPPATIGTRNVPMALSDLKPGTMITRDHIGLGPMPVDKIDREVILSADKLVGRVVKEKISAPAPLRSSDLYGPNENPPLDVKPGMRAIAIGVGNSTAIVDGLIKPGSRVDVLLIPNLGNDPRADGGFSKTILKGIRVIAINRNFATPQLGRGGNTVTLELTERQTNEINLANSRGTLTLAHNPSDAEQISYVSGGDPDRVTFEQLLGLPPVPEPEEEEEPEPPFETEIFNRSNRGVNLFRDGKFVGTDNRRRFTDNRGRQNNDNDRTDSVPAPRDPGLNVPEAPGTPSAPGLPTAPGIPSSPGMPPEAPGIPSYPGPSL